MINAFRRFKVIANGELPSQETLLTKIEELTLKVDGETLGVPEPIEWGWSGGRHVSDVKLGFEHNVFNDCLWFAIRIDTNKVPGSVVKSMKIIEEEAVAKNNPSGFISKTQKREVKDTVQRQVDELVKSGKYRRTKILRILWDLDNANLYCKCSNNDQEKLFELFERTFGMTLSPLSSGLVALRHMESIGRRRQYEDLKPTRFVIGPAGEGQTADYPWVAKSTDSRDFLGNEFLLWLWNEADNRTGIIPTSEGDITIMFDKSLTLDCVFGENGKDALTAAGPTRMPEAKAALASGKVPRKATLIIDAHSSQYTVTVQGEKLEFSGLKMPNIEDADTPRAFFEEQIDQLRDFDKAFDALFNAFLAVRTSEQWAQFVSTIGNWITAKPTE